MNKKVKSRIAQEISLCKANEYSKILVESTKKVKMSVLLIFYRSDSIVF